MRTLILLTTLSTTLAWASHHEDDYSEQRRLTVDAEDVQVLDIDAGAGSLAVRGVDGADEVIVNAVIRVSTDDEDKARAFVEERLNLSLRRDGERVWLKSKFDAGMKFWGPNGGIDLDVQVPRGLTVVVDDGSGSIVVEELYGDLSVDDGSGSIRLSNVGSVEIDDGSGGIGVSGANGDVVIEDGSGGMTISKVSGSVTIRDGSGGITVDDVIGGVTVEEDGSGSVRITNVQGPVSRRDQ